MDIFRTLESQGIVVNRPFKTYKQNKSFFIEEVEKDDVTITHFYYDYSDEETFDYVTISKITEDYKTELFEIFVNFADRKHEKRVLNTTLEDKDLKTKNKINEVFHSIVPIYYHLPREIQIHVDTEGINYLEYSSDISSNYEIQAKIFNVCMKDLYNVYNFKGDSLFRLNIRQGITNKLSGKELKETFATYIKNALHNELINLSQKELINDETFENVKDFIFNQSDLEENKFNPSTFWMSHNGITIFVSGDENFNTYESKIVLNPLSISVINGAQTLTNFYEAYEELFESVSEILPSELVEQVFNKALSQIFIKTIFIYGDEKYSIPITEGLNKQIPIDNSDFLSVSIEADEINKLIKPKQLEIPKTGKSTGIREALSPLQFVKYYYIIEMKPGRSKNFNKTILSSEFKEISKNFSSKDADLIEKVHYINKWWPRFKRYFENKEDLIMKYGKNYFQSYVMHLYKTEQVNNFTDEMLEENLSNFRSLLYKIQEEKSIELQVNSFKSDDLFNTVLSYLNADKVDKQSNNIFPKDKTQSLISYLNNTKNNKRIINYLISKFNKENNIQIESTRTISLLNGHIKESFPFPNSTFDEIVESFSQENKPVEIKSFEESTFYNEIRKNYNIFVIYWDANNNEIENIKYIKDFSFLKEDESLMKAKKSYDTTIQAFRQGDKKIFPNSRKSSDNIFHIRPKAVDSTDSFKFTDGTEETKRTFWASKWYLESLREQYNF